MTTYVSINTMVGFIKKHILNHKAKAMTLSLFLLCAFLPAYSVVTTLPYTCGFEYSTENNKWQLNFGTDAVRIKNKWVVSYNEKYAGMKALIISNNNGTSATYTSGNDDMLTTAVRRFNLPKGTYQISFYYKCQGQVGKDELRVAWTYESSWTQCEDNDNLPYYATDGSMSSLKFDGKAALSPSSSWKKVTTTINHYGGATKLVFLWRNNETYESAPSACIDNIEIIDISKPADVIVNEKDTICMGESYVWRGQTVSYVSTGKHTYTENVPSASTTVADSIFNLELWVGEDKTSTIAREVCQNSFYQWNGNTINTSAVGDFVFKDTIPTSLGCDSVMQLDLKVSPVSHTYLYDTVCQFDTYRWMGTLRATTSPGESTFIETVSSSRGCDSVLEMSLLVNPIAQTNLYDTVCQDDVYVWESHTFNTSVGGDFTHNNVLQTSLGCDSIITMHLRVNSKKHTVLYDTVCQDDTYIWKGSRVQTNVEGSQLLTDRLQTVHGCDSTVEMHLRVNPTHHTILNDTVCQYGLFIWSGQNINTDSVGRFVHYDTVQNQYNCDSLLEMQLVVNPTPHTLLIDTVCQNEPYVWLGRTLPTAVAGTSNYYDTLATAAVCDSMLVLTLTVNPTPLTVKYDTVCQDDVYTWQYRTIDTDVSGSFTHYDTMSTVLGCDSMLELHLVVNPEPITILYDTVCQNDSYTWKGAPVNTSRAGDLSLFDSLQTALSCDSLVEMKLTINPVHHTIINDTICQNSTYVWQSITVSTMSTGDYIYHDTVSNKFGCDSTLELRLFINPTSLTVKKDTVCQKDAYVWEGMNINTMTAGQFTYYDTIPNVYGCDSILKLDLDIFPTDHVQTFDTICQNDVYVWRGMTINTSVPGLISTHDTVTSPLGCNGTFQHDLLVKPTSQTLFFDTVCQDDTYMWEGRMIETSRSGLFVEHDTLTNVMGCDSTLMLTLVVNPTPHVVFYDTVCQNDVYVHNGNALNTSTVGTFSYKDTLTTDLGCDSVLDFKLTVNPVAHTMLYDTICQFDSYGWQGRAINTSLFGTYTFHDTVQTIAGCDSSLQMSLTIHKVEHTVFYDTVCQNDTYVWDGRTINTSVAREAVYRDTLMNVFGCDSMLTLNLKVNQTYSDVKVDTVCQNDVYMWQGRTVNTTVEGRFEYYDTLNTVDGCDSTFMLTIYVNPVKHTRLKDVVCVGEVYMWKGEVVNTSVVADYLLYDTLLTSLGCDSTIEMSLSVNESKKTLFADAVCQNDTYVWEGRNINTSVSGVQVHYDTLLAHNGCDSVLELTLRVNPVYDIQLEDKVCQYESYVWNGRTVNTSTEGEYVFNEMLRTSAGCDSVVTLTLTVLPIKYEEVSGNACQDEPYVWNGKVINTDVAGSVVCYDTLISSIGCDSIVQMNLMVNEATQETIYDTVCQGYDYVFVGSHISKSGVYVDTATNAHGCNHYMKLYLEVVDRPTVKIDLVDMCADDDYVTMHYTCKGGQLTSFSLTFDQAGLDQGFENIENQSIGDGYFQIPIPKNRLNTTEYPRPDQYNIQLSFNAVNCDGGLIETAVQFTMLYPSWVIEQHWNDAVAVLNDSFNGGYTFSKYQWYRSGSPIKNGTSSYYYDMDSPDKQLRMGEPYHVCLTRTDDGKTICSCPIYPKSVVDEVVPQPFMQVEPTYVSVANPVVTLQSMTKGVCVVYDSYGKRCLEQEFNKTTDTQVKLPAVGGVYIFYFTSKEGKETVQKVIVY